MVKIVDALIPYLQAVDNCFDLFSENFPSGQCLFRGQSNAAWGLKPTLFRLRPHFKEIEHILDVERALSGLFFRHAEKYVPQHKKSQYRDFALMQHYGCPTRLLDWTSNPLVAAYFAIEDLSASDAAVFITYPKVRVSTDEDSFGLPKSNMVFFFDPPMFDQRIEAQGSKFGVHGIENDQLLSDADEVDLSDVYDKSSFLSKIVIKADSKERFKASLNSFGVNQMSVYPSLNSVGDWIKSSYESEFRREIMPQMFFKHPHPPQT